MSTYAKTTSAPPFPFGGIAVGDRHDHDEARIEGPDQHLPHGWHQLETDLPGARLFRVEPDNGGMVHWMAEMEIDGRVHSRRCASELYARWWLGALVEPKAAFADIPRRRSRVGRAIG